MSRTDPYTFGFTNPVHDAQRSFRQLLDAMSHPGRLTCLVPLAAPTPLYGATLTTLLTLADNTTPVCLNLACNTALVRDVLALHSGAPVTNRTDQAVFAVLDARDAFDADLYKSDDEDYPDRSCTLIVQCGGEESDKQACFLKGPGLQNSMKTLLPHMHPSLAGYLFSRHNRFPLGLDLILTRGDSVYCLPRSTVVSEAT